MATRLQNRVAGSRLTLPVAAVYGVAVWLAGGLMGGLWIQFVCFAASVCLMVELNNSCALIRVYSGMVPAAFIGLTCAVVFISPSISGAWAGLFALASLAMLFRCYQDKMSAGHTFYAFACLGVSSLFYVQMLYYAPVFWLMMAFFIRSMSWRTLAASVLGLCLPYWLCVPIMMYTCGLSAMGDSLSELAETGRVCDFSALTVNQVATFGLVALLCLAGTVHCYRQRMDDKIRTRMFYNCFVTLSVASAALAVLLPRLYDPVMRMMAIGTAPLMAHFMALTKTRLTNVAFCLIVVAVVLLTAFNLWMPSTRF